MNKYILSFLIFFSGCTNQVIEIRHQSNDGVEVSYSNGTINTKKFEKEFNILISKFEKENKVKVYWFSRHRLGLRNYTKMEIEK